MGLQRSGGVGWYGTPDSISEERATEIIDAAAEYIVRSVEEVWQSLAERAPAKEGAVTTMRAAVLRAWNDLAVEDVEVPEVDPGEVLVRVRACGLCGTDLKMVRGAFQDRGWPPSLPFVMGHEWSGEVVALGEGLDDLTLRPGDKVVAENHVGCGRCPMCRRGRYNLCERSGTPGIGSTDIPLRVLWPSTRSGLPRCSTSFPTRSALWRGRW